MPPTKTKLRHTFDVALAAYLEAIQEKKTALFAAASDPSKQANRNYKSTAKKEKAARRQYRGATKKLHALVRNC